MLITAECDGYFASQDCKPKVLHLRPSNSPAVPEERTPATRTELVRGLGLPQSIALNISNMVGIGPFITIPGFIAAMHGPQALIAWKLCRAEFVKRGPELRFS